MNQIPGITLKLLRRGRFSAVAVLIALGLLLTAAGAKADCAVPKPGAPKPGSAPAIPFVSPRADAESNEHGSIVGLWHVVYTGTYNDNFPPGGPYPPTPFQFNESFKTWHADGTEFENAFLPPSGNNICYGVWKDVGNSSVKLHHIGLMFNSDGSLLAIFTIDETDTVSPSGMTYKGMFDFKLWPPSYEAVGVGTPISEVRGTVLASRITVE